MALPGLIAFDLDFTLWDCDGLWVDSTSYPFQKREDGSIVDSDGRNFRLYEDVPEILNEIDDLGIPMALASRTEQPAWAQNLLELMGIRERFAYEEIYPSSKTKHFSRIAAASGVELHQMWFFDDENRNIVEVGEMGVTCVEVRNGLTRAIFDSLMP